MYTSVTLCHIRLLSVIPAFAGIQAVGLDKTMFYGMMITNHACHQAGNNIERW